MRTCAHAAQMHARLQARARVLSAIKNENLRAQAAA